MKEVFQAAMLLASGAGIVWSFSADSPMHSAAFWVSLILFIGYLSGKN